MTIKKWSSIEDCPQNSNFLAILKFGWRIRIRRVYVHTDNHFLSWKDLRTMDGVSVGPWKCLFYFKF